MFKWAGVSQGQYPDPDMAYVTVSVSQKEKHVTFTTVNTSWPKLVVCQNLYH